MAQTLAEIRAEMDQAQAEFSELDNLNSPSALSVWGQIKNMFALLTLTLQKGFEKFQAEIDQKIVAQQIGTLPWYVDMIRAFQYGDPIQIDDNRVTYGVDDPEKRIIAQASASEVIAGGSAELLLKAVKDDGSGNLTPLSVDEKESLQEYINKIKFAGVKTSLVSAEADVIRLNMTVELNLLMLNNDGSKPGETGVFPVKNAIEAYFKALPFDGTLYWNKLIDHLQTLPEVKDAVVLESWSFDGTNYTSFTRLYDSYSGHLVLDPLSVINYV